MTVAVAILTGLFTWWFSTGAILWLVGRIGTPPPRWLWATSVVMLAGFALVAHSVTMTGAEAAYYGFFGALMIWGWLELTFLTGLITGPNKAPCPPGLRGWRRFVMAWGTIAHHELSLVAALIALLMISHGAADHTGLLTFAVLFAARIGAKVNVYAGVPSLSADMLPTAVGHLKTYFRVSSPTLALPIAITALSFANACWIERAIDAPDPTGFTLLATLTGLALLEHWLMVVPVRDSALWQWAQKKPTLLGGERPSRST